MPPQYRRGYVVWVWFPFEETNDGKTRPGIILEKCGDATYTIVYITKTDLRKKCRGRWVDKRSEEGREMNLVYDCFVNYDRILDLNVLYIDSFMGICPFIDEIDEALGRS